MFGFRIIETADGNQIIDTRITTPYSILTPVQMVEYMEVDSQLSLMVRMERKAKAEAEQRRKLVRNPLYRIACMCGLVQERTERIMFESKYFNLGKVVCTATINNLMSENKHFAKDILSAMELKK